MPADTGMPTSMTALLIAAVVALAGVIAYLFRHYQGRLSELAEARRKSDEAWAQERLAWAVERANRAKDQDVFEAQLRLEFEGKHRTMLEDTTRAISEAHIEAREREDMLRREYTKNTELIAEQTVRASEKVAAVMTKIHDRYVSPPRARSKG